MSLIVNGITIPTTENDVIVNGVNAETVYANGVKVWEKQATPGSQTFTSSGTFTVPAGYYEVTICMCGGGGGGGASDYHSADTGGGYAGEVISQPVSVTPEEEITIIIGSGGNKRQSVNNNGNGYPGTFSKFGTIQANGGSGGTEQGTGYAGNGQQRVTCGGTRYNGAKYGSTPTSYGGQAGAFGNGGNANSISSDASSGGVGAGGGGKNDDGYESRRYSGAGGRGQCVVSWS